jgi:DNA polymerase-1
MGGYRREPRGIMSEVVLVDAYNFMHRAYHQVQADKGLSSLSVTPPNLGIHIKSGVFLVSTQMLLAAHQKKPDARMIFVWDKGRSGREKIFPDYKKNRESHSDDSDFRANINLFLTLLYALGVENAWADGFEADDVIAVLSQKLLNDGHSKVYVLTTDKDMVQLLADERIVYWRPKVGRGSEKFAGREYAQEKFGVGPERVLLYRTFAGDDSDAIPGIPTTGRKKTDMKPSFIKKMAQEYDSIQQIYDDLDSEFFSDEQRKALKEFEENAQRNWDLMKFAFPEEIHLRKDPQDFKQVRQMFEDFKLYGLFRGDVEQFENKMKEWEESFGTE